MIKNEILILYFEIKHKEGQGKVTIHVCLVQEDLGYILIHVFHYFKFMKI